MHHLLRIKTCLIIACVLSLKAFAQRPMHLPDRDLKRYYFGILLQYNRSYFHFNHANSYLQQDSIAVVESPANGGLGIGLLATYRFNPRLELRSNLFQIYLTEKSLRYNLKTPLPFEDSITTKRVESVVLRFPLLLKYNSDRFNNFRFYAIGGIRYDFDLASNAKSRNAEDLVKLTNSDLGIEAGIGFHFYFPVFVLSPEIKISNGWRNLHVRDESLKYSNVIDRMQSRQFIFSIIIE